MNILNFFRRNRQPENVPDLPPAKVRAQQTFKVKGETLSREVESLDAFYAAENEMYWAQKLLNDATQVEKLKSQDQSKADLDPRVSHVVIPKRGFEYHSDTTEFQGQVGSSRVHGNDQSVTVEHTDFPKANAVWNRETGSFQYNYEASPRDREVHVTPELDSTAVFSISPRARWSYRPPPVWLNLKVSVRNESLPCEPRNCFNQLPTGTVSD